MSEHEHDNSSDSEQPVHSDEHPPSEPHNDTQEDLTETSGERQDPVSNTGLDASTFAPDLGDPDPDENPIDAEQTADDLDGGDISDVETKPTTAELVITITDGLLETDFEGASSVESVTSVAALHGDDLQRLRRVLDEEAARRGVLDSRPFKDLDTDSLLVLYNQVRAEMGTR